MTAPIAITTTSAHSSKKKTLIVCDVQPDVALKLGSATITNNSSSNNNNGRLWVDLVSLAVQAARREGSHSNINIVFTQLHFTPDDLQRIPPTHPRLGILNKLATANRPVPWFTSDDLCVPADENAPSPSSSSLNTVETLVRRTSYLPHSTDTALMEALSPKQQQQDDTSSSSFGGTTEEYTVVGYGPTVQAVCHILGDVLAAPNVQLIREAIGDENSARGQAFLDHGCLFGEQVISMVDYLESLDVLHTQIPSTSTTISRPPPVKYVCDVGRGGHLSLFLHYLTKDYGYVLWPTQPWYQEQTSIGIEQPKQYNCPLGRRIVELCDEPQFGSEIRFFLVGRKYLDEKDLLYDLVPELLPPTFSTIEEAQAYAAVAVQKDDDDDDSGGVPLLWFLKKVNQNGGRAVQVLKSLPTTKLEPDDQLQAHIPRPLLWEDNRKCHVKTYQWIGCTQDLDTGRIEWQLYQHDLYYLATAINVWDPTDTSDDVQITTMRTHRLYRDHPWRIQWKLTELCQANLQTVLRRAIEQGKLQVPVVPAPAATSLKAQVNTTVGSSSPSSRRRQKTIQFEIHSADWMLDQDGRMYLIECNGIPVLYDPGQKQPLLTKGLNLYEGLYRQDPKGAVVNDHELMRDAVQLAMKGTLPKDSLWTHLMTVPGKETTIE